MNREQSILSDKVLEKLDKDLAYYYATKKYEEKYGARHMFDSNAVKRSGSEKDSLTFQTYVGQSEVIKKLQVFMPLARQNSTPLPHMLFMGNGGLGKTSLARVLAGEMQRHFVTTTGENLANNKDVYQLFKLAFNSSGNNPIIFIDEIHQMRKQAQEAFYNALEDGMFYHKTPNGVVEKPVPPFTLIGGTTNVEKLRKPFLSRFVLQVEFKPYTLKETAQIAYLYFKNHPVYTSVANEEKMVEAALVIGKRSKGIARNVVNHCFKLKNFIISQGGEEYTGEMAERYFEYFGIDKNGLDSIDYNFLKRLYGEYPNPVGLKFIASLIGYDQLYIEQYIEPWLLETEMMKRTKRGRIITEKGVQTLIDAGVIEEENAEWKVF